jgi:hypothetical protein
LAKAVVTDMKKLSASGGITPLHRSRPRIRLLIILKLPQGHRLPPRQILSDVSRFQVTGYETKIMTQDIDLKIEANP